MVPGINYNTLLTCQAFYFFRLLVSALST